MDSDVQSHGRAGDYFFEERDYANALREFDACAALFKDPTANGRFAIADKRIQVALAQDNIPLALSLFKDSEREAEKVFGAEPSSTRANFYKQHAGLLIRQKQYGEALQNALKADAEYKVLRSGLTSEMAVTNCWQVARCYRQLGKPREAREALDNCRSQLLSSSRFRVVRTGLNLSLGNVALSYMVFADNAILDGFLDDAEEMYKLTLECSQSGFYPKDARDIKQASLDGLKRVKQLRAKSGLGGRQSDAH